MGFTILLAAYLSLTPAVTSPAIAPPTGPSGTWSGALVDSRCYASEERNVNKETDTNHDRGREIRVCRPTVNAKSFAVVQEDGQDYQLDPAANAKIDDLVQSADRKSHFDVAVIGQLMSKDTLSVDAISLIR